jgi:FKBP-type peptidyl-prolyl cis-trans isomerase
MKQALVIIALIASSYLLINGIKVEKLDSSGNPITDQTQQQEGDSITETVTVEDIVIGTGDEVLAGDTLKVHYVGTLTDGTKFDSSRDRGEPFEFTFGVGEVITGWDQGLVGMKIGGIRKLTIPASLGYGEVEQPNIPANSTLIFEVEVLEKI